MKERPSNQQVLEDKVTNPLISSYLPLTLVQLEVKNTSYKESSSNSLLVMCFLIIDWLTIPPLTTSQIFMVFMEEMNMPCKYIYTYIPKLPSSVE